MEPLGPGAFLVSAVLAQAPGRTGHHQNPPRGTGRALSFGPRGWLGSMKQYRVVGFDAKDERLYEVVIEAPNQAIARMMVLAQMCRNFATAPLADRTDKLVVRLRW
jgi:hypothetical protein